MRLLAASLALVGATLIHGLPANAGEPSAGRLSRPVATSATGPDGRLTVSGDATVGNLVVDQYSGIGRISGSPDSAFILKGLQPSMCSSTGAAGGIVAWQAKAALKGMSKADRARLKSGDAATLTDLSIRIAAGLDGASADAIRADEALGPGVYHDAIGGFRTALVTCKFYGAL